MIGPAPTAAGRAATLREPRPPRGPREDLGRRGEDAAARHLEANGYRILHRRWRARCGEIDLVALDGETLVFVEVKARSGTAAGLPGEAVGPLKQRRLARVADVYLLGHEGEERECRFDVVEVFGGGRGALRVRLIKDAFQGS